MSKSKKITLGGRELTMFPCPTIGLKAIGKNIQALGTATDAGLDALIDGIYYGVKRGVQGDETITREFFEWNIDAANVAELTRAFAEVNGMVKAGDVPPGEA